MRRRWLLLPLLVVLAGCSVVSPPPPAPTAGDLLAQHTRLLELSWRATSLDEIGSAPLVQTQQPLRLAAWGDALRDCMAATGHADFGFGISALTGFTLVNADAADVQLQVDFYRCVAVHPLDPGESGFLVTAAQLDYVYDYYEHWTVPCLLGHDYELRRVLSRQEFATGMGEWTPYAELPIYDAATFEAVIEQCGPARPPLRS